MHPTFCPGTFLRACLALTLALAACQHGAPVPCGTEPAVARPPGEGDDVKWLQERSMLAQVAPIARRRAGGS